MSVAVSFPALLSDRIDGVSLVHVDGETIRGVLAALTARHPPLAPLVWHGPGGLSPVLVVFHNGAQVDPEALDTPVSPGDEVMLVPAIEGGAFAPAGRR